MKVSLEAGPVAWWEISTRWSPEAPLCAACGLRMRLREDGTAVCCNVFRCAEGRKAQTQHKPKGVQLPRLS